MGYSSTYCFKFYYYSIFFIYTFKKKILNNKKLPLKEQWELVVKTYAKEGLLEHDAFQQAQVARILRHGEYNKKTGEVTRWQI